MAYRLDLQAAPAVAVRLAASEQLEGGAEVLRTTEDPAKAVHEARKHVKKTRALLRLIRPSLGKRTYRAENAALRDASRKVSHLRDADVMIETLNALEERSTGEVPIGAFEPLRKQLARHALQARSGDQGDLGAEFARELHAAAARVDDWPLTDLRRRHVREGIGRAYRRGRDAFAVADADPSAHNLHEWRKRVKDLWYHQRLLEEAWPAVLEAQAEEAHVLSEHLGDDHDLAVLAERLADLRPTKHTPPVLQLVERRREELLADARSLGRRIYADDPKAFDKRLKRILRSPAVAAAD